VIRARRVTSAALWDAACALAAFTVPAAVYIASASHEPASWDTAELQGVPYILGIAHPTGFPLYVLVGYVWSHAVALGSVAFRMNAMSGVAIAVACLAAYQVARLLGAARSIALLATLWFAFTQNVWAHGARAEAQNLAVACEAVAIYAFLRCLRAGGDRWYLAAFALCGLALAAHPNALWLLPAFAVGSAIAVRRPSLRICGLAAAVVIAGLAFYLYLPLRSAYVAAHGLDPAASLPGAGGGIFWNYNDPRTLSGLTVELTGAQFQTPSYFAAAFNPLHAGDAIWAFINGTHEQFGTLATLLLFAGLVTAWRRDWRATLVLCIACTLGLFFSVVYPNEGDVGRYRILASWLAVPLLGALSFDDGTPRLRTLALRALLAIFLAAGAATAFFNQRGFFSHEPGEGGRWVISAVRSAVPPGSVIVTGWLDATSLAYGAYVDGSLPGRVVVSDNELRVDLYRQWAAKRRVFVLADPHSAGDLAGARRYATLDNYHELFSVTP
jgi:hypothetical protein